MNPIDADILELESRLRKRACGDVTAMRSRIVDAIRSASPPRFSAQPSATDNHWLRFSALVATLIIAAIVVNFIAVPRLASPIALPAIDVAASAPSSIPAEIQPDDMRRLAIYSRVAIACIPKIQADETQRPFLPPDDGAIR